MWIGVTSRRESLFVSAPRPWLGLPSPEITFSPHCSSSGLSAAGGAVVRDNVDPMSVGALVYRRETLF